MCARRSDRTVMNRSCYTLCINKWLQNGRKSQSSRHDEHDHFDCIAAFSVAWFECKIRAMQRGVTRSPVTCDCASELP